MAKRASPETIEEYIEAVRNRLVENSIPIDLAHRHLSTYDELIAVGFKFGVGPNDCAVQIIADAADA